MQITLLTLVALLALVAPYAAEASTGSTGRGGASSAAPTVGVASYMVSALNAANAVRAQNGAAPLCLEAHLIKAAENHSRDMANRRTLSHTGGDGRSPFQRMSALGYSYTAAAENILYGSATCDSEAAIAQWKASSGHFKNMINRAYTQTGVAMVEGTCPGINIKCCYWTETFGASSAPCLNVNVGGSGSRRGRGQVDVETPAAPAPAAAPATVTPAAEPAKEVSYDDGLLGTPSIGNDPAKTVALYQAEFLSLLNAHRHHRELSPVCISVPLQVAAQRQVDDVATTRHEMTHLGSDGSAPADRIRQSGFTAIETAEIIAAGDEKTFVDPAQAFLVWRDSTKGHNEVLETKEWTHVGVAKQVGACPNDAAKSCTFWIATFGVNKDAPCAPIEKTDA
ncbi:hypothetical protein H9P43_006991 [Blastocladiella emersonii ATCC 22665]|nr:hypothetical protein H9P43_006991 [Blastocladiella emersonii ATCC 22665]